MLKNHEREKLLNAIIFFAQNTRNLGKVKLWNLLYFLDFQHYRDVGRSVTGLQYFAWPKGPVPVELQNEVEQPEQTCSKSWTSRCMSLPKDGR